MYTVKYSDVELHFLVRANITALERSLLDFQEIIKHTDISHLSITIRELGLLKESIESLEEKALKRKKSF